VVHRPALLIADEPTGSLDSASSGLVLELLRELNEQSGIAILMATHDAQVASFAQRVVRMKDGQIIE
jgi:putative ABC transport system ATP-binding protein